MEPETLEAIVARHAIQSGHTVALEYEGRLTTFAELHQRSAIHTRAMLAYGLIPGDRVAYLGKNTDRYFELLLGAASGGVVMVPVGWRLSRPEIAFVLEDAAVRVLFCTPEVLEVARALREVSPALQLVCVEEPHNDVPSCETWQQDKRATEVNRPAVTPQHAVLQLYTSGTTGHPKGVILSHANLFALRPQCAAAGVTWDLWRVEDVSLLTMPVAHVSGSLWGLIGLHSGVRSVVLPEFDAARILQIISTRRIAKVFLVPAAIQALLLHPAAAAADYSRLRYILYGASPISLALLRAAITTFKCGFVQNYGMTETCGSVVALAPEDHFPAGTQRLRSASRALPGVEIRIVDGALTPMPPGTTGEVLVRSPTNMSGYWNRPEATAETLIDGWIRTGDAGYLDADGYLYIQDRLKDMIISGAENVYPLEVENVLSEHPAVREVAVIGVPDERWGEAVTAIIVPSGSEPDAREIIAWARDRLAGYKLPKEILFSADLPRNAAGKLLRRKLREPFWVGKDRCVN